jgi:hypothetical protein
MFAASREQVAPYGGAKLLVQKAMSTLLLTSQMLAGNKASPKRGKFNQNCFISSVLPYLMKGNQGFTRKIPVPPSCSTWTILAQWRKDHAPIGKRQVHPGSASTLLARPESLRLLPVWILKEINGGYGVNKGRSYCRGNYDNLARCRF